MDTAKASKKYIHISQGERYVAHLRPQGPDGARVLGTKDHLEHYNAETALGVPKRGPSSSHTHHSLPVSLGSTEKSSGDGLLLLWPGHQRRSSLWISQITCLAGSRLHAANWGACSVRNQGPISSHGRSCHGRQPPTLPSPQVTAALANILTNTS